MKRRQIKEQCLAGLSELECSKIERSLDWLREASCCQKIEEEKEERNILWDCGRLHSLSIAKPVVAKL